MRSCGTSTCWRRCPGWSPRSTRRRARPSSPRWSRIEDLPNAVGLNSASFNAARLIGPGVAGLLIAGIGIGWVFVINAASFLAVVFSLTRMRIADLELVARPKRAKGAMRAGMRYVRKRPDIILILVVIGLIGMFGINFQMTTAIIARLVFDKGAAEYGLLGSIMAIGSLAGALISARRDKPSIRLIVGSALVFGFLLGRGAHARLLDLRARPHPGRAQRAAVAHHRELDRADDVAPAMRGRVMALYMAIFMGATPIGAPIVGWIAEAWGPRWSILFGGLVSIAVGAVAIAYLMWSRHLRLGFDAQAPLRIGLVRSRAGLRADALARLAAQQAEDDASAA